MFRRCLNCGKSGSPVRETACNLSGEYKLRFCSECWAERVQYREEEQLRREARYEVVARKLAAEERLNKLRKAVEKYELEQKALTYGIIIKEGD